MRIIFFLLVIFSIPAFTQKTPVGLIVKFYDDVSFFEKQEITNELKHIKPIQKKHELKGFNVTLLEGDESITKEQYLIIRLQLENNSLVEFTSILYKTINGAIGGDLQDLYLKPKNGIKDVILRHTYHVKEVKPHHYLKGVWVYTFDKNSVEIRKAQTELLATNQFDFVSVNTLHTVLATVNDPYFENQWALKNEGTAIHYGGTVDADMNVAEAWTLETGNPAIKIAVLDSGTDTNHIDLMGNLLPGFDATGGDSKGYPNTTYSNDGHGTCTAGIIAAIGDNEEGIAGIAYNCKVIPVKIFYYVFFGGEVIPFTSSEAGNSGIIWAVNTAKADILSNSWGLRNSDIVLLGIDTVMANTILVENITNGREEKGTPMLFSSGNDNNNYSIWPASHPKTISVGASSMCDERKSPTDCSPEGWWGSNYGTDLDVMAPGVKVLATDMMGTLGYNDFADDNYSMFNGTSAACPNAAGVMALILSADPSITATDARAVLSITADKTGGYTYDTPKTFGLWSNEMGYGRVNAYEAVYYVTNFSELNKNTTVNDRILYQNEHTILQLDNIENSEVVIYSLLGTLVTKINKSELTSNTLNLSNLVSTNGLYLIQINRGDESVTLKAIISK